MKTLIIALVIIVCFWLFFKHLKKNDVTEEDSEKVQKYINNKCIYCRNYKAGDCNFLGQEIDSETIDDCETLIGWIEK